MKSRPLRIALLAGEPSGDVLGGSLLEALKARYPNAEFCGIGGPLMQQQGLISWFNMETLSVMGLVEVLKRLPALLKLRKQLIAKLLAWQPDVFVGIDAPDFNLGVEIQLKAAGIPTVHYVSPSVWAWRQKRIIKIAKATHLVLALLPFEKRFYDEHQVPCEFVGHTLADDIPLHLDPKAARAALGLTEEQCQGEIVAILPGSRAGEVNALATTFLQAAQQLASKRPGIHFLIPAANAARYQQITEVLQDFPALSVTLLQGQARQAMAAADAILLASGTVALEAMLVKRPMVVAYKLHWLTFAIVKRMAKVRFVALPNLLADEALVPELLQEQMTPEQLSFQLNELLEKPQHALMARFTQLHEQLRLDASARAADHIDILMKKNLKQDL